MTQHVWIGNYIPLDDFFKTFMGGLRNTHGRSHYVMTGAPGFSRSTLFPYVEFLIYSDFLFPSTHRWIGGIEEIKSLLWDYERFKEVPVFWERS